MPSYHAYLSQSCLYKNELFGSVILREIFQAIVHFLNFGEEPTYPDDRLAKIRFLTNHLNNNMQEIFTPPKMLSLAESML